MENKNNKNDLFKYAKKSFKNVSFVRQDGDFSKTLRRFFSKKINLFSFLLFLLIIIFVIFSAIIYPYSSNSPVLNSSLAENLPPTYSKIIKQTIETGDFYNLIKSIEVSTNFKLISETQFAGLVTLTYNPYDLIFYASLLNNTETNLNTILGTNSLAIDNFSFFIGSFGISLLITLSAVFIQFIIGSLLAVYIGYYSNVVLKISYYVISAFGIIPFLLFSLIVFNIFGYSHSNAILIIGFIGMPLFFFNSYVHTSELKNKEFIKASIATGASSNWIVLKVIFPKVLIKNLGLFSENTSISLLVLASLSFFNVANISNHLNIGSVFKQIIDDFSNLGFSFMVIIITTLFIMSLKVMGINFYIASQPRIQ